MFTRIAPVAMLLAVAGATGQEQKPNFTGAWVLVAPADAAARNPGQVERITQTAETLTRGHDSEGGGHKLTYKLDGTEIENRVAGMRVDSRARWEGSTLILVDRAHTASGALRESTLVLSLNENGDLLMGGNGAEPRWTYKKKH
jgi:hypothetical protein